MILFGFIIIVSTLIYLSYKENKTFINLITLLFAPYLLIIPINNWFFSESGFYYINNESILSILISMLAYFLGAYLIKNKYDISSLPINKSILGSYNMKRMTKVLYFIAIIALLKLIYSIKSGAFNSDNLDDTEGLMGHGPIGHILLIGYIITPFVFLYWTYKKKFFYLLPVILIIICSFASLVKYHVIGLVIMIYLFVGLYRRDLFIKGGISLISLIVFLFIFNYALTFFIHDASVDNSFFVNHFWKYASGSIIYQNYIVDNTVFGDSSIFYRLLSYICTLPNMFLSLIGIKLFPKEEYIQTLDLSYIGEEGNVVNAFGDLYPSAPTFIDLLVYIGIIFLIGLVSKFIYVKRIKKALIKPDMFLVVFLTYFVFLTFFGTYAALPAPWELLVWSIIIPPFFLKNKKIFPWVSNQLLIQK